MGDCNLGPTQVTLSPLILPICNDAKEDELVCDPIHIFSVRWVPNTPWLQSLWTNSKCARSAP